MSKNRTWNLASYETYSPQDTASTTAVVEVAVAIFLNSLSSHLSTQPMHKQISGSPELGYLCIWTVNRELKQQRQRRLQKRHLKSEFAFISSRSIRQMLATFSGDEGLHCKTASWGNEKENRCLVFTSSTKREIRNFQVVVVQRRQINVPKKRDAGAKLLFCLSKRIAFYRGPAEGWHRS